MSLTILSIFGLTGLSIPDGGGGERGAACVAAAVLDSARRTMLNATNMIEIIL